MMPGNTTAMLSFFLACVPISFLVLLPLRNQPHSRWKSVDIAIVLSGALGLVALVFQAQFTATQIMAPFYESKLKVARSAMVTVLRSGDLICVPHPRIQGSPLNNEEIEGQRAAVCTWYSTQFKREAQRISSGDDIEFNFSKWTQFPKVPDNVVLWPLQGEGFGVRETASDWNDTLEIVRTAKGGPNKNFLYLSLLFFSPYLLSVVFSLQLVKLVYEKR